MSYFNKRSIITRVPSLAARMTASVTSSDLVPFSAPIMGRCAPLTTAHKCWHCATYASTKGVMSERSGVDSWRTAGRVS